MKKILWTFKFILIFITLLTFARHAMAQTDVWTQKADFGGVARYGAFSFSIGNKGYFGAGYGSSMLNDFWEYDPSTDAWTQKADFEGGVRYVAVGFSIGAKGYAGTGTDGGWFNDFWEYDPSTNDWTKKNDFQGGVRYSALGFSIGNKGYLGFGYNGSYLKDFWEYDPSSDNWTQLTDFGGVGKEAPFGFSIGNKGYVGGGYDGVLITSDFWEYDPSTNLWEQKQSISTERWQAKGFSIGNKGYVGAGSDGSNLNLNDFWEYDPSIDNWTQKNNFGGTGRSAPAGFSIGNKGYLGLGNDDVSATKDFWEYAPAQPAPPSGNAIQLNGTIDLVQIPYDAALQPQSLTFETWVNFTTLQAAFIGGMPKNQPFSGENSYGILFTGSDLFCVINSTPIIYPWAPLVGEWNHVAFTYNSSTQTQTLYLNGTAVGSTFTAAPIQYTNEGLTIGSDVDFGGYGSFTNGKLDEVRVWNVARTQSEIQSARNTTLLGTEPGLVAYYKLDETGQGAGITVANSATATGASLNGVTAGTGTTPVFTTSSSTANNSIKFNGINQEAQLGTWFNYQNFTISMWVKPEASQVQYADILDNNHGGNGSFVLQQNNFNANQYYFGGVGSAFLSTAPFNLSANVWQHVTLVSTSTQKLVYVNGSLAATVASSGPINYDGTQSLRLARWGGGARNWNGEMDEVKIYDRAFSASEVLAGVYSPESPTAANLQAYYKLNETSGSIIYDASPNGRNGTLINGPTFQLANLPAAPPATTISSFTPTSAGIGSTVTISGTNFSTTPANNSVSFNSTAATVTASTTTSITTKVPVGATTGTISVTVAANTATSAGSFTVLPKTVITADSLALVAFYNSTNGSGWYNQSNWLTGSVNTWYGVTVASNRVTRLDLLSNNLSGSIPAEIGNLTGLTTRLDLSFNSLTGPIPSQIGQLTSLTYLEIGQNQLSGNVPPELGNLTLLTVLNISRNLLTGDLPASIGALPNLSTIGLNENSFTSIPQFISSSIILFNVYTNKLTFEDLEPNVGIVGFNYTPQKVLPGQADQFVPLGQTLTITYVVDGVSNIYQWAKDGTDIPGATSATYSKPNITLADNGLYILKITNSQATGLTLTTQPILVNPPQNALNFVGASSDQVIIPNASILNPTTELTIEAWVNLPNVLNNQKIIGKTNFNGYLMAVANGGIYNEIWNSGTGAANGIIAGTILPNEWTHLAVTFKSGANMVSYINGVQVNSIAVGPNPIDASFGSLLIGNSYGYFATGTIDEVALWNVARTQAEIQADLLGSITPTANLIAYFDFNQGIASGNNAGITTITDKSTYGNNGTLSTFSLTGATSNWVSGFQLPPAPTITGFSPIGGSTGNTVTITGTNFSTTPSYNLMKFNGLAAVVTASTATTITATVPSGVTDGFISVNTFGQTATSAISFISIAPSVFTNGKNADVVLGQSNFTTSTPGTSATKVNSTATTAVDPTTGKVFVLDGGNNRILRFSAANAAINGSAAEAVIGQADFTTSTPGLAQNKFNGLWTLTVDNAGNLWVVDFNNNRVLQFANASSLSSGANATSVLGQPDFTSNLGGVQANRVNAPAGVAVDNAGNLYVGQRGSNRVSRFDNAASLANGSAASAVFGQPNFTSSGGAVSQSGFNRPNGVAVDNLGNLWVADELNGRVMRFANAATATSGANAASVLGKANFTTGGQPAPAQNTVGCPLSVSADNTGTVYVGDWCASRILIYPNAASLANGSNATAVLGQPNFTSAGGNLTASGLANPGVSATAVDAAGNLWVGDAQNRALRYNAPPLPTISSFSPTIGEVGTSITITGTNFSGTPVNNVVKFNGTVAIVTVSTTTSLTTTVPVGATSGPMAVTVNSQTAISSTNYVVGTPPPVITSFTPLFGLAGTTVTITGTNFSTVPGNNIVKFNGTDAVVTASTSTSITTSVPVGSSTGFITVTVGSQTATSGITYIVGIPPPTITSFSPLFGDIGTTITITGTNFSATPSNNIVKFNGTDAVVTASTSTSITATVPVGSSAGFITVTVGSQTATSGITYFVGIPPPAITNFSPLFGDIGTTIIITGTNFSSTPSNNIVKFNGTDAVVTASTSTSITTSVPVGSTTGFITVTVGSQTATSGITYFVGIPPPAITSFSPLFGDIGTTITITGTNFSSTPSNNIVKFNGTNAVVTASSSTSITTTVPVGSTTGFITVTVGSQTATSGSGFTLVIQPPTITLFSPSSGAEGSVVTISGTFFSTTPAGNTVKFNGTTASVTASTSNSIITSVPIGASTGAVTVTRDGLTATSATNFTITVSAADSLALVALYNSTNGINWTNKTNWLTGNVSSWFGVIVTNGKITSIVLPSNNLTNSLPAELATLDELTTVNVSGNRITALPNLSANTTITSLNVSRNKLEFGTLEANATIPGIIYSPQDSVDIKESVLKQLNEVQTFNTSVSGTSNSYQWKKNGVNLSGATGTLLTLPGISFTDDAIYQYEVTSTIVVGLTLYSRKKSLRVSSLERDAIALTALYNATNGPDWKNKTNWISTPLETGNWFGVTISSNRVTQVKLPNNNLKGPVSEIVADIQNLSALDLSSNQITSLPDLTSYPSISTLDVSKNNLDFSSLIVNAGISGINYANQADIGSALDTLVNVGSPVNFAIKANTAGNVYRWKRNGVAIPGATANTFSIGEISRSNSGTYVSEITNPAVPGLTLRSAPKKATAVANISGQLLVSPTSPVTKGKMLLLKINPVGIAFDTTRVEPVTADGTYSLKSVVLDDYILIGQGDREIYKDYFPTYFKSSVFWEEADTIRLNESRNDLNITLTSLPALPKGEGILSGIFEEETSGGRVEGRGRVSGASVTVRRQQNAGRPSRTMAEDKIAAFLYTDEDGAFEFENLEEGFYLLNIQYPGVPMDQKSDIIINIGSKARKQNVQKVEALATGGKIVVRRLLIVGLGEEQQSIQIYPNPVSSTLFINLTEGSGVAKMKMFDFSGKEVLSQELKEGKTQIDLSPNSAGVYLIKIFRGGKEVTAARLVVD